jgi:hypothetical protein
MITLTREEAQQVLKVLEYPGPSWPESRTELAVVLRYKLSAPELEPVAWQSRMRPDWEENGWTPWKDCSKEYADNFWETPRLNDWLYEARALYTAPPQRKEWIGLTDEEIISMRHMRDWTAGWTDIKYAREIEAKLKEKNYDKY